MYNTPIQSIGGIWLKRDDLFEIAGVRGGKVRTCWRLSQGSVGLVTAGSRCTYLNSYSWCCGRGRTL